MSTKILHLDNPTQDSRHTESNTQGLECKAKKKKKRCREKLQEIRGGVGRSISTFLATGKCKPLPGPLLRESCISNWYILSPEAI